MFHAVRLFRFCLYSFVSFLGWNNSPRFFKLHWPF
jgi:hypothetical protein